MITKKDWIIICIIAASFTSIGLTIGYFINRQNSVVTPPGDSKYTKRVDSLITINKANTDTIKVLYKHIQINDSLAFQNLKKLSHDKKVINSFTPESRRHYLDSLLKGI